MGTFSAKPTNIDHDWFVVDATDKPLGRLASKIAFRLRGKHKPEFTPHVDTGDYIVVINAAKVTISGAKRTDKIYYRHSGYPGGLKSISFNRLLETAPTRSLEHAIKGMMPKGPLGRQMLRKLRIYAGDTHRHSAQQPQPLSL